MSNIPHVETNRTSQETDEESDPENGFSEEQDTSVWLNPAQLLTDNDNNQNIPKSDKRVKRIRLNKSYSMSRRSAGTAMIFNHEKFTCNQPDRPGTNVDCEKLEKTLKNMKFKVETYQDLTYREIKATLEEAAQRKHSKRRSIMIIVMTHGSNNCLYAADGSYRCKELWESFNEEKCPNLANRPKIFIVQACQGKQEDVGTSMRTQIDSSEFSDYEFFDEPDFLIVYSTVPLHYSWRNKTEGTRMIQELVKGFIEDRKEMDILTLLTFVNQRVCLNYPENPEWGQKQVMRIHSTLTSLLHLRHEECAIL